MLSVNPTKYYLEKNLKKNPNMMPITWELGNSDAGKLGFLPLFERFNIVSLTEEGKDSIFRVTGAYLVYSVGSIADVGGNVFINRS